MATRKNRQTATATATATAKDETMNEVQTESQTESTKVYPKIPNAVSKGLSKVLQDWSQSAMRAALASDDQMLQVQALMFPSMFQSMISNDTLKWLESPIGMLAGLNATIAKVGRIDVQPVDIPILRRADQFDIKSSVNVLDSVRVYRIKYIDLIGAEIEADSDSSAPMFNLDNVTKVLVEHFAISEDIAAEYATKMFADESADESDIVLIVGPTLTFSKESNSGKETVENCLTLADISSESGKIALSSRLSYFGGTLAEYRKAIAAAKSAAKSEESDADKSEESDADKAANDLLESMQ